METAKVNFISKMIHGGNYFPLKLNCLIKSIYRIESLYITLVNLFIYNVFGKVKEEISTLQKTQPEK